MFPAWLLACAIGALPALARSAVAPAPRPMVVAAAHALAADAGMQVLRDGGDAVDAAVAVQAMLGLVEPQSSGLGGGAFMLRYDAATRQVDVYDGREVAPAAARHDQFLDDDGRPLSRATAMLSGRATGVPGVVALLHRAHAEHGRRPWGELFESTARQADAGFAVSERLERHLVGQFPQASAPDVRGYFSRADGATLRRGDLLRNPTYAAFLRRLAAVGVDAFYRGEVAAAIVRRVAEPPLPGSLTVADMMAYRALHRAALCRRYRRYRLCTSPPPSSGVGLLQLMALLERTDIGRRDAEAPLAWQRFAAASRLMYADRDAWVGDPAFGAVPVAGLLQPAYVRERAARVDRLGADAPLAGRPPGGTRARADATLEPGGTSHFVIVDAGGNAVSMTTTVESYFGSGRMVEGFFLNNQLTDFSFLPEGPNAIAPGKRPRSSMSPVLILDERGTLLGAVGSPGGNAIPAYVAKTLVGALDWKLPMQRAIDLPNLVARGERHNGEVARMPDAVVTGLRERGIVVVPGSGEDSGIHGVLWRDGRWDGGADSRREGVVRIEAFRTLH